VTWSLTNGTGQATINSTGLVTAVSNGTVTARATAADGSNVYGTLTITISTAVIPVTSITVAGAGGATTINPGGTLQLSAAVLPANATNQTVTWSLTNGTGQATINSTGLVTAVSNGTVTARATAADGSNVYGTLAITISTEVIPVTSITVTGAGGATTMNTRGTLQLSAAILPANATNKAVTWSLTNGTGQATINSAGLVSAVYNGTVTAIATTNDGSQVTGTILITILENIDAPFVAIVNDNELKFPMDECYFDCKINIYNLYGHLMKTKLVDSNLCVFDISSFSSGLYVVVLSKNLILKVVKVIVP
jgi:uncharacterized protein YjdB